MKAKTDDILWDLVARIRTTYKDRDGDSVFRLNQGEAQEAIREYAAPLRSTLDEVERTLQRWRTKRVCGGHFRAITLDAVDALLAKVRAAKDSQASTSS